MSAPIAKTYEPASIEAEASKLWIENKSFSADPAAPGEPYCIVIPPPNVTGALHLGHAINNTLQDILIRLHRMRGFNTLWVPGIDHAGIATQAVVERQLKEKENKTRHDVGREELVKRIWAWKQQYGDRIVEQLKRLGCSCDWDRTRFTLDEMCARAVRETFFKLFRDGLIYRGKRLVNWDVHLQTSVSDDEVYHETVKTFLWHIRYPIMGTEKFMVVATTRPETMLGDTAVAVHSQDPRWNWAIGGSVQLPLTGRTIPIIADDILVDPKFGSGVVKVTPAHDPNDYAVWQRQNGKIDILNILNMDGTINANGGPYAGMKRDAARKKIIEDLQAAGLLEKEEPYEAQVGHSDRSKTPVEPYLSDQWFVKMAPLAEPALQVVRDGTIKFFPERHAQQYLSWLGEKRDWPISRQLWWGHRIPVWRKDCASEDEAVGLETAVANKAFGWQPESNHIRVTHDEGKFSVLVCMREDQAENMKLLTEMGFVRDPDVLDTWFSSALWPHSTLGWPEPTAELKKWYPGNVLLTGRDIITLWVARMVMTGLYNLGRIPFHHVVINPTILDGKGERMSKMKGNGVDPVDVIDTHGADALRFTLTHMATETQDMRMPVKRDAQGRNTSEKFDLGSRFCNKIWQVAQFFVIANLEKIPPEPVDRNKWTPADQWIVSRFNRTVAEANAALEVYRFDQYAKTAYDFFYGDFCDWYVEVVKLQMKVGERAGQTAAVLAKLLDDSLRLLHPILPFITEIIWRRLREIRPDPNASPLLIRAAWPIAGKIDPAAEHIFTVVQEIVQAIRRLIDSNKIDRSNQVRVCVRTFFDISSIVEGNREVIGKLAGCVVEIGEPLGKVGQKELKGISGGKWNVNLENNVDPIVEQGQKDQRMRDLAKQITILKSRLSNEAYTAKAPPNLVQQTRDQLAEAEAELARLE